MTGGTENMDIWSVLSGILIFLFGFGVSQTKNSFDERRRIRLENRRFFYAELPRLIDRLMDEDVEYWRFWGLDEERIKKSGKSVKMAAYFSSLVDAYHNLYKDKLQRLVDSEYSLFNKIMRQRISQEYWQEIVRPCLFGSDEHEIVQVVDRLVERYSAQESEAAHETR